MQNGKKIIAMIPVRLGSQRVPKKNLRILCGKPLVAHIIEAAVSSQVFDEIYINSESEVFKEITDSYKIKFYKRPEHLASDSATNDDFALDFIENVPCDILIQLLATSPFLGPKEIQDFVKKMAEEEYETLISVKNDQIECVFQEKPINFDQKAQTPPSQKLTPVQAYACGIMGWEVKKFKENIKKYGAAYHGGDGKIGFFQLKGFAILDIDKEEDFQLAEAVCLIRAMPQKPAEYYKVKETAKDKVEVDVWTILKEDGVEVLDRFDETNKPRVNIDGIVASMPKDKSWSIRLVNTENNSATLISQLPGEGNRLHYHANWNEWWYIVQGKWEWEIEGEKIEVQKGDLVFIKKGKKHKIKAIGAGPAVRLAVSREDVGHIYPEESTV